MNRSHPTPEQSRRRRHRDDSGVVAVEFALVLPFLLAFVFLLTDLARLFNYTNDVNQLAANGARMAAVNNYPGSAGLRATADTSEMKSASGGDHLDGGLSICLSYPSGSTQTGNPVKVTITGRYKMPTLAKLVPGVPDHIDFSGSSTMRLERASTATAGC
ncbi:pilus assembly protein [Paraconexibacter antarcticus]|uniref:Pilus assembly protein n=1 Tax=Paraconexibacter antarcticus TaxID=2949664 RepID=A0ABY5DWI4_9ACTN|nr:TadE family protein [Paraconexibacter antarcticus]UTI65899.1 pilus assembly protein [Paraconexibacter antarcticus]